MQQWEYRLEAIPLDLGEGEGPGKKRPTQDILDRFGREGWEVLHFQPTQLQTSPLAHAQVTQAALVLLKRPKG